jgi:hypothetical protein
MCFCNYGFYGSACEYSFCSQQSIEAESGDWLDRTANSPFPLMTARFCSWSITVPAGKQASVQFHSLQDTLDRFIVFVVDGAFTFEQIFSMNLSQISPLILATSALLTEFDSLNYPSVMPINCSSASWAGCTSSPPPPRVRHLFKLTHPLYLCRQLPLLAFPSSRLKTEFLFS